jgi:hypothetical protein
VSQYRFLFGHGQGFGIVRVALPAVRRDVAVASSTVVAVVSIIFVVFQELQLSVLAFSQQTLDITVDTLKVILCAESFRQDIGQLRARMRRGCD